LQDLRSQLDTGWRRRRESETSKTQQKKRLTAAKIWNEAGRLRPIRKENMLRKPENPYTRTQRWEDPNPDLIFCRPQWPKKMPEKGKKKISLFKRI